MPTDMSKRYLNNIGDLVVITNAAGICTFVNPAYCRIFGKTPDAWVGNQVGVAIHEEDQDGRPRECSDDDPAGVERSYRIETEVVWIEWQPTDLDDGSRLLVGRDITLRKERAESERQALKAAETAGDAKMNFLATMSHEMRTPLNGILGMTGLLMETGLDPNQQAYADAVHESGSALLALINDILDYSKIDAGKIELEATVFDPISLVQSVAELLSPKAAHKELEIASYVDPSVPHRLYGDEARLRQVLLNLAGNGVKFTEAGGVSIEVYAEPVGDTGVSNIRIDVRDTGVGIPSSDLSVIFDEFAQADSTRARKFEGTGLGLAIARRIVRAMGGDISAKSAVGVGSIFSFKIPLNEAVCDNSSRTDHKIRDPLLLVTRSKTLARVVKLQLQSANVKKFRVTNSVEDAYTYLRKHRNAILLCDLPFAAQHGRKLAQAASHSLVLLSPIARGRLDTLRSIGFKGYLIKPMRQSSLIERLSDRSLPPTKTQRLDSPATAPRTGTDKFRILVAEDNQINAVLATAILKRAGHHVDVAGNGFEAIQAVQAAPYDLIFMDMHMPELDGLKAAAKIRALPGDVGNVPIVALTANALRADKEICFNAGMDDFLTKPFDPTDITRLIGKWAGRDSPHGSARPSATSNTG